MNDNIRVLRIGKISSVNRDSGSARVTYEDRDSSTTNELPLLAWTYWMPQIGDRVLVGHLSNGSASAVILGPVWHDGHTPEDYSDDSYHQEMGSEQGEAYLSYWDGILTLHASEILFDDPDENATTTVKQMLNRIAALESKYTNLAGRVSALEQRI